MKYYECLRYIYEECGDEVDWKDTNFSTLINFNEHVTTKECFEYIESIKDDWKAGLNKSGAGIKPVKRS